MASASSGCISAAANLPLQTHCKDSRWVGFGLRGSELPGRGLRISLAKSSRARKDGRRFKVFCVDYPRPELANTVNFLEAAKLSVSFQSGARRAKPLKVVIAQAGEYPDPGKLWNWMSSVVL